MSFYNSFGGSARARQTVIEYARTRERFSLSA